MNPEERKVADFAGIHVTVDSRRMANCREQLPSMSPTSGAVMSVRPGEKDLWANWPDRCLSREITKPVIRLTDWRDGTQKAQTAE